MPKKVTLAVFWAAVGAAVALIVNQIWRIGKVEADMFGQTAAAWFQAIFSVIAIWASFRIS